MKNKILSLLGIARRAGRLAPGHDAAIESIVKNRAVLCILCSDASTRLEREMRHACSYENKNIPVEKADFDIKELSAAIGTKAAVITVNDDGFAKKLITLFKTNTKGKE